MKIATITFHRALNYGAIFQTYALQKKLIDLKIETEVLDYRSEFIENHYKKKTIKDVLTPKKLASVFLFNSFPIVKRSQFDNFVKQNIKLSKEVYTEDNISKSEKKYDKFLVGSDQVWNYKTAGFDKNYFLEFIKDNQKKNSYAASIGLSQLPDEISKEYNRLLKDYANISIRENEGTDLVKKITNRNDVITVLDPSMLLKKDDWVKLEKKCDVPKKYIFLYLLSENKEILKFARKIAKKYNCEILYVNNRLFSKMGVINKRNVTPEEWLYLIHNAEYVVTNSFHGTVFSIIYKKIFWTDYLKTSNNVNSRIKTLLNNFGLFDRVISEGCNEENNIINYEDKEIKINKIINESINYLKKVGEINE